MRLPLQYFHQPDGHTCGLQAARVIYHHYGRPSHHLRDSLRVDERELLFKDKGVLPVRLYEVLKSDGFVVEALDPNKDSLNLVRRNLELGHPTLALQGDLLQSLHWVVIGGVSPECLHLMDSNNNALSSGWRQVPMADAAAAFLLFVLIHGWDGESRPTSLGEKIAANPGPGRVARLARAECKRALGK